MSKKIVLYHIGFYKFTDAKNWNRTNLFTSKTELKEYLDKIDYVDKTTIVIYDINLPE